MAERWSEIDEAALDWAVRTGDPAFDDWEAFTAWLEAEPRHADAYHAAMADAEAMTAAVAALPPPPVAEPPARRAAPSRWIGAAVAASLVATLGVAGYRHRAQPYAVETEAGASRTVTLADGSRIALNGGTRLILDHGDARFARLERGEALFTVKHDPERPFRVDVGDDRLVDVGTEFDVTRSDGSTRVGVAEGAVIFNPRGEQVRLDPGDLLHATDGEAEVRVSHVARDSIGGWRTRQLDYAGTPLREVAADLARALGRPITVAAVLADRPFRGTIQLDSIADDPARLGALIGARVQASAQGWEIVAQP